MQGQRFDRLALRVVEAAYGLDQSTDQWLQTVLQAVRPALDRGLGLYGIRFRLDEAGLVRFLADPVTVGSVPSGYDRDLRTISEALPSDLVQASFAHHYAFDSANSSLRRTYPELDVSQAEVMASGRPLGIEDNVVAKMMDADRTGLVLVAPVPKEQPLDRRDEPRWRLVMTHVLAGLRLRRALGEEDGDAVLEPNGRLLHAEGDAREAPAREALRHAAIAIDRARSSAGAREPDEALQAWRGLVAGHWSLVDRFDRDGRRYLVARRNEPSVSPHRGLSLRERQIAAYAALGHNQKRIAYTLGLAPSTVSSHLRAAMQRLGIHDVAGLAEIFAGAGNEEES